MFTVFFLLLFFFFFFNDPATTEIYTLSLHDALPIFSLGTMEEMQKATEVFRSVLKPAAERSEEHTSELQSLTNLVCRLLLEKKKKKRVQQKKQNKDD